MLQVGILSPPFAVNIAYYPNEYLKEEFLEQLITIYAFLFKETSAALTIKSSVKPVLIAESDFIEQGATMTSVTSLAEYYVL